MSEEKTNYLSFLESAIRHSGLTKPDFLANAKVHPVQYNTIMRKGTCLLRTAMRILNANGYVCVIKYEIEDDENYQFVEEPIEKLFERDWSNYRYLTGLKNIFWQHGELTRRACEENGRDVRSLRNIIEKDNADIALIFGLARSAGYKARFVLKKDKEAAAIMLEKLNKPKDEKQTSKQ